MTTSDSSDSPQSPRKNPARRDPRLDAKPPAPPQKKPGPPQSPPPDRRLKAQPEKAQPERSSQERTPPEKTAVPNSDRELDFDQDPTEIQTKSKRGRGRRSILFWGLGLGTAALIALIVAFQAGLFQTQPLVNDATQTGEGDGKSGLLADAGPVSELRKPRQPVTFRLHTPEDGFVAFVDEHPVRDAAGQLVLTPCEVEVERGEHVIRVEKHGWNDTPKTVQITQAMDIQPEPLDEPFNYQKTTFKAPYLNAKVGEPILLQTLQLNGRSSDPFVSVDGREIWYAGSGPGGIGIYYSSRTSMYEEWDTPAILVLSKGTIMPAAPSATENGLIVAYTTPGIPGLVWSLFRKSSDEAFDGKKELHFTERGEPNWPSAQLSADGTRLYWYEIRDEKTTTWYGTRPELNLPFGKFKRLALPGGHPCLSADGLRQYVFDGKKLQRARRPNVDAPFFAAQVITEINLTDYVPHPERRQFWVTEDEQWLYYSLNPEAGGELYVVRLNSGPGRGVLVTGKSIPSKKPVVVAEAEKPEMTKIEGLLTGNDEPEKAPVDPKSLPTPYAEFQQKLTDLLSKRDYTAVATWVKTRANSPELQASKELVEWDQADIAAIQKIWDAVDVAVKELKPDDPIRIGGGKFTFDSYADGVLHLTASTKKVERKLRDLSSGDILALADKVLDKAKPETQFAGGVFLHFEGKAQAAASKLRLEKAGSPGTEFRERLAIRRLRIIEQELARQNLAVALQLIDELVTQFPKSPSAEIAEKHRTQIYSFVKWKETGGRDWERGDDGSYIATPQKKPGALLMSELEYGNFDLSLEWRTTKNTGQGGIYFRYNGTGNPLETAFKIHLANDAGVKADKFCTGSLFNVNPPTENAAKPLGQWNTLKMQVRGERVLVLINGKKVQESLATDASVPLNGVVALDGEFGGIDYRKILLVESTAKK